MGKSESSVFIGGAFSASQLLWILPVVDGFCREKDISKLVLEKALSKKVLNLPLIQKVLEGYEVVSLRAASGRVGRIQVMFQASLAFGHFVRIFALAFGVSRNSLLEPSDRYTSQIRHAVWDSACLSMNDGSVEPSFLKKVLAAVRVVAAEKLARQAVTVYGVRFAFLGHTVYHSRATLAVFQRLGVQVFAHAGNVIYECPAEKDTSWASPSPAIWNKIASLYTQAEVENYWAGRKVGNSTYADSEIAAQGKRTAGKATPKNLLLLHVFRDSPFNQIDEFRIFADYIDWVRNSLLAVAKSEETWMIKAHPSATRWGENQQTWISEICKFAFGSPNLPPNVTVSDEEYSNMDLFAHADRVVTFSGTGHLEAAAWGIKPITIMEVALQSLSPSAVFVPRNRRHYLSLLSIPSSAPEFILTEAQIAVARSLLFARENVLGVGASVGQLATHRGDSTLMHDAAFDNVLKTVPGRLGKLALVGEQLARGVPRSISLDYIDRWRNLFAGGADEARRTG